MSPTLTSPALMTGAGMILGTAAYMAPEQAEGRVAGVEADLYSVALVLYEALTGVNPVAAEHAGNLEKMAEAWLQWGRENGYR